MPLRDHFRPPLDHRRHWEGMHGGWPMIIVAHLREKLPRGFFAEPKVHSGSTAEIDVASFEDEREFAALAGGNPIAGGNHGGVATAVWAPPRPSLSATVELPDEDIYEVQVFDERHQCRLVAAVEIVSPRNKDRRASRTAFVAKCAGLLCAGVSVTIVDLVTTRVHNLYSDVLEMFEQADSRAGAAPLYAAACRITRPGEACLLESWSHQLAIGQPLPTLPLWLANDLAVPLELESSYEQSCRILGIA